jgi:hypothetical protein
MGNRQRGSLLLSLWPRVAHWQWGALVAFVATIVFLAWRLVTAGVGDRATHWGQFLFWMLYVALFAFPRPVRFYENGVWFQQIPNTARTRFVSWEQIDRYHFEGDVLILTGTDSSLKGGPVTGGVFHLRPGARERIEPILARCLSAKTAGTT